MKSGVCFVLVFGLAIFGQALTPSSFLTTVDQERLKRVFNAAWDLKDLPTVHYGVLGYKLLGQTIPNEQETCKFLQKQFEASEKPDVVYFAASAAKVLKNCPMKSKPSLQGLVKEDQSVADMYYTVLALRTLGLPVDEKVLTKNLQAALKKDDSLINLGYGFHIASTISGDVTAFFDRIEDAVVQSDDVGDDYSQFEGGLSISALIVSGIYRLSEAANQSPGKALDEQKAIKFANYFLSRRSVQLPKGAYFLLDVLKVLATNKYHTPVAISLSSANTVSETYPTVQVRVCDLFGNSLGPLTVTADSVTRMGDEAVVLSAQAFTPVKAESTLYGVNLMSKKMDHGFYKLAMSAKFSKGEGHLIGNTGIGVVVKVLTEVKVERVEVGTADADQSTVPKMIIVSHPSQLSKVVAADYHQKLLMKFILKDKRTSKVIKVHQAFVMLQNEETKQEIIFVAEQDSAGQYKFEMDVNSQSKDFGHMSGQYELHLIVGDPILSNSFSWNVGKVKLKFPEHADMKDKPAARQAKPEIKHMFREPEKRPPSWVSTLFTWLPALPVLVMLILWVKLGINMSNFPFTLSAVGFHLGLGGIFTLYVFFWYNLNMFDTLKYLCGLGIITFLCGHKLLSHLVQTRPKKNQSS